MLKLNEAADFLGVSKATVRRLDNLGFIRSYRVGTGRHRRFRQEDLQAYLEQNS